MTGFDSKRKAAQDKLAQPGQERLTNAQIASCIEAADSKWADAEVPVEWARHFAQAIQDAKSAQGSTRKDFEEWAKSLPNYMDITRFENGYSDCNTDHAWAGWQAAQPAQEPVAEEWKGQSDIESPHNACQHRNYCKQLKKKNT
jgi:hypothetical protein